MHTSLFWLSVLSFTLLLVACGDDGTTGTDAGSDGSIVVDGATGARVELGTGMANFEEIPRTGAEMELVAGPQGGWHLWVTARLYGLTIEDLLLSYRIEQEGASISMPVQYLLSERRLVRDGDRWLRQGDFVVFDIASPDEVVGERVDVVVVAEPPDGPATSDRRTDVLVVDVEP